MKKIYLLFFIILTCLVTSCLGRKDPFRLMKKLGNFHTEETYTLYYDDGEYIGKQIGDTYYDVENDISYTVSSGVLGSKKEYTTDKYYFSYDFAKEIWYREIKEYNSESDSTKIDYFDKNNYDYSNGVYTIKKSLDLGNTMYVKWYTENGKLVLEYKTVGDGFYGITKMIYVELDDKTLSLSLPTNYKDK